MYAESPEEARNGIDVEVDPIAWNVSKSRHGVRERTLTEYDLDKPDNIFSIRMRIGEFDPAKVTMQVLNQTLSMILQ